MKIENKFCKKYHFYILKKGVLLNFIQYFEKIFSLNPNLDHRILALKQKSWSGILIYALSKIKLKF